MHGLPFFSLKKANKNLYEKLPPSLKIAKLSVSYSNQCFNRVTVSTKHISTLKR